MTQRISGTAFERHAVVGERVPDIHCDEFSLFGSDLLVRAWGHEHIFFALQRKVMSEKERHELNITVYSDSPKPETLEVFLETDACLIYVGNARAWLLGGARYRYVTTDPDETLDPCFLPHAGWDGVQLVEALGKRDRESVVRQFIASWFPNLPPSNAPATGAPEPIARWQELHAQLTQDDEHAFQCYPPTWHGEDPSKMFFINEEQNGGTFFAREGRGEDTAREGAIWHSNWIDGGREVLVAKGIWEFALQFVIYILGGAHVGYCGYFHTERADDFALPIGQWPQFLDPSPVVFIGGPGWIGTAQDGWASVRATSLEVLRAVGQALSAK